LGLCHHESCATQQNLNFLTFAENFIFHSESFPYSLPYSLIRYFLLFNS
jgi:hypothetical protein